ncbi:MAG: polysaccharide deacetylase [Gemmatimonadetes bacterium]|nr:polysaccharide deacetylase [Gemmatimonadota bacterium]
MTQSSMQMSHRLPRKHAIPALAALAALIGATACQPSPDPSASENIPGWQWSDEQVLETVNAVRAGRSLQPDSWPGGARVAVLLSFDVDNETVLGLRYGDATVGSLSKGQFGARVALPRVVDLLDREGIPASFFIPAVSLVLDPSQIGVIQAAGHHEFAIHGWIHELNSSLEADVERALLQRAVDYMTEVTGTRPLGYRAPSWNFSPNTLGILREMGFLYDSSLMADDRPYEIDANGEPTGMIELPVEWILDDAPLFNPLGDRYSPPRDVLQVWKDDFDGAYAEGTMFLLTMHPHVIGHRSRIVVLDELIQYIKGHEDVWFGTHLQAARWVKEQAGM